jgi:hypothetical protein
MQMHLSYPDCVHNCNLTYCFALVAVQHTALYVCTVPLFSQCNNRSLSHIEGAGAQDMFWTHVLLEDACPPKLTGER